jgi:RHS repeat-associated protein
LDSTGEVENDYLFAGEQFDGELEQYYLRQRFYDAGVGRFTRRDTYEGRIGEPITLHKYLYGNANPVNFTDPSGLSALSEFSSTSLSISQQMVAILAGVGTAGTAGIIVTNDRPSPTPFPLPAGGSIPDGPGAFPNNDGILDRILDFGRRMGGFGEGVEPNLDNRLPGFGESVNINDLVRYIFNIESNPVLRDLINQSQPGPETKGRSTQYISSGGKENATKIFDALNLSNIIPFFEKCAIHGSVELNLKK